MIWREFKKLGAIYPQMSLCILPNTVYWLPKNFDSFYTIKKCEPALLGSSTRAIETIPLAWELL